MDKVTEAFLNMPIELEHLSKEQLQVVADIFKDFR